MVGEKGKVAKNLNIGVFVAGNNAMNVLEDSGLGLISSAIGETDSPSGYTFRNTLSNLLFDGAPDLTPKNVVIGCFYFWPNRLNIGRHHGVCVIL